MEMLNFWKMQKRNFHWHQFQKYKIELCVFVDVFQNKTYVRKLLIICKHLKNASKLWENKKNEMAIKAQLGM